MAGILILPALIPRFGKRNLALAGSLIVIAGQLLFLFNPQSYGLAVVTAAVKGLGEAPLFGVIFSFIADAVEYGQWKTHIRQEGYISSDSTGAAVQQPASAVSAISNIYIWAPVVIWGVAAVVLFFYKLDKQYAGIMEELEKRESRGEL